MGLFKKKKKPDDSGDLQSQIQAAAPKDAEIIDPKAVEKAQRASDKPRKEGGYNWINIRKLALWQRILIAVSVVFMIVAVFLTGRVNKTRSANLTAILQAIQAANNELTVLQTTGDVVTEIKTDTSAYHDAKVQKLDDMRVQEVLNGSLRWKNADERELVRGTVKKDLSPEESFLNTMFGGDCDYAGYRYNAIDDDSSSTGDSSTPAAVEATEMQAVSNFVSSMTGMIPNVSRTYYAIFDFTYGSNDGHMYTKTILLSYTVYQEGTLANLAAYALANGAVV